MPVTRICASVDCSTYAGAGWWMARISMPSTGPSSSTGSPMTLMMRPSMPGPTGTEIGAPVSIDLLAAHQALGRVHGDAAHGVLAEMLGDFEHQPVAVVVGLERVEDRRQVAVELRRRRRRR